MMSFRSVFVGLTATAYLIWFCGLLPHPHHSKWLNLAHQMPNALLLNVLGFNGNIPTLYKQQGDAMPWHGGWHYLGPAVIVGLTLLITAVIFGCLQRSTKANRYRQSLLLAIPFSMLLMAVICSLINLASPSYWQAFVQDQAAMVYRGIIIPQTHTQWPILLLAILYGSIVWTLQYTEFKRRLYATRWQLNLTMILITVLAILTREVGMWITGPHPPVYVMEGGYNSAKFLILASLLWLALTQATKMLLWKRNTLRSKQQTTRPWQTGSKWMLHFPILLTCILLGSWLLKLAIVFSDLPSQRWCHITFHHTAEMGGIIQFTAAGLLLLISINWYRAMLLRINTIL
ncbi:MAG: hypothetical protein JKX85_07275 [Phycisphaeraceae bacterium]|nr:hypothetical protein [Phycisphaeraceae bacterium]